MRRTPPSLFLLNRPDVHPTGYAPRVLHVGAAPASRVYVGCKDGTVTLLQPQSPESHEQLVALGSSPVRSICEIDDQHLVVGRDSGQVVCLNRATGRETELHDGDPLVETDAVRDISLVSDTRLLVSWRRSGTRILDFALHGLAERRVRTRPAAAFHRVRHRWPVLARNRVEEVTHQERRLFDIRAGLPLPDDALLLLTYAGQIYTERPRQTDAQLWNQWPRQPTGCPAAVRKPLTRARQGCGQMEERASAGPSSPLRAASWPTNQSTEEGRSRPRVGGVSVRAAAAVVVRGMIPGPTPRWPRPPRTRRSTRRSRGRGPFASRATSPRSSASPEGPPCGAGTRRARG